MSVDNLTPEPPEGSQTVQSDPTADLPQFPKLKSLPSKQARKYHPAGRRIERAINRLYRPIFGFSIGGRRLFQTLLNLGDTDPQEFIEFIKRDPPRVEPSPIDWAGRQPDPYGHLPLLARRCAVFAAAKKTQTQTQAAQPQTREAGA
jgi:hypothetical protein